MRRFGKLMHAHGECAYPRAFFHIPLSLFYKQRPRSSAAQRDAGEVMHMHCEIPVQWFYVYVYIYLLIGTDLITLCWRHKS